ncbi:MAG: hypothetical protein IPO83_12425 [Chitinophagaceae bacterium]|nr:hypothetical protein [Chitinophagaceae bacterium]
MREFLDGDENTRKDQINIETSTKEKAMQQRNVSITSNNQFKNSNIFQADIIIE